MATSRELLANSVTQVLPLVSAKLFASEATSVDTSLCPIRCRFASNAVGQCLWTIRGSQLDIISVDVKNVSTQRQLGSFDFGHIFGDNAIKIVNVVQLMDAFDGSAKNKYLYTFAVALRRSSGTCLICLVDARLSLVMKTIDTQFKITSLELIMNSRLISGNNWPLIDELLHMNGIIAIGTEGGIVFLLDLFLDYITPLNETLIPKKISFIVCNSSHMNLKNKRKTASLHDQHLCLPLNGDSLLKNRFIYKADDGTVLSPFPKEQVYVSALHYIPQTGFLCVGYNFGGFQFYNMNTFKLECSCGLEYGLPPVIRFAFQDPENDPKNYSYVWVIRGQEIEELNEIQNTISNAIMYSISFEKKDWIPDYGILYSGFQGCSCRFEYILSSNPHSSEINVLSNSRLIDCYTIPLGNQLTNKSSDDESANIDLSLLFISWEALSDLSNETYSSTYFAIFDLNQWYRSQMPTDIKIADDKQFCPFLGVFSLENIANTMSPDAIVSVQLNRETISKYRSQAFQDDIHYYPSSLSFEVTVLSESQICGASYLGLPKFCLAQLVKDGPKILIDPKEYAITCVRSGLLSLDIYHQSLSTLQLRHIILNIALENDCLPFLIQVVKEWSSGDLKHCGCDSKCLLDWIWSRVALIKNEIDSITHPLFDFSGQLLDNYNSAQLYAYESDLKSLNIMLKHLQTSVAMTNQLNLQELTLRQEVTQLITLYLRTLLWFYEINLLPEHSEEDVFGEQEVAYPYTDFKNYYIDRRTELHNINPDIIQPTDLLLIDGMVESLNPELSELWIKGGGDGLYPPPNLHSLLGVFLLESATLAQKQALMLYMLLDLAEYLNDRQSDVAEKIRQYPQVFALKSSLIKSIQAFWGLDHKLFDFSLQFLLDPVVKPLFLGNKTNEIFVFNDLQQRIVQSFVYQNEVKCALIYSQNCGQFALDTPVREKLHLNMLLLNNQICNAIQYQRLCRNETNATELLIHLFDLCERMGVIEEIFKIPLDMFEEEVFTNYLVTSDLPNAKQKLVLYLIANNKIIDAANVLNEFEDELTNIADEDLVEKTNQLIILIKAYLAALPQSFTKLAKEIAIFEESKQKQTGKITVSNTLPIQVKPKPIAMDWMAPSTAIENIMEEIADIWKKEKKNNLQVSTPPVVKSGKKSSKILISQNSPFLRTPTVDRSAKKVKQSAKTVYPTPKLIDFESKSVTKHKIITSTHQTRSAKKETQKKHQNDLLILLETPQIKHKSISNKSNAKNITITSTTDYFTPQSILKANNLKLMMKRSLSPLLMSPSVSAKGSPNKTIESTQVQHRLRFSIPDNENSFTEESRAENPRLASIKDTLMLMSLKNTSQPIMETEMEDMDQSIGPLIDFDKTTSEEGFKIQEMILDEPHEDVKSGFVFSPPQTRLSSARKKQQNLEVDEELHIERTDDIPITSQFTFSQIEEQKTPKQKSNRKSRPKKNNKDIKETIIESTQQQQQQQFVTEEVETSSLILVSEEIKSSTQPLTAEPTSRSRSPTPASRADDSDSKKSDVSHVSSSKTSTSGRDRSSRSKTPTKKSTKKSTETPTHTMKLRGSTTKSKKE
ncbi:protein ELYS-like [Oppia nitens]|uniref:protein ELYS-like n=1 Tax=Oppia nitens TaxID=1686743 RepID=UPI0023DC7CB7|nr:protein ELYS-like [Oppia nitens]